MKVWLNGKIIDSRDAKVSLFDRGFLYGDGVFETMRAYDGAVFMPGDHLSRLQRSLKTCRITMPYRSGEIASIIGRLLKVNRLKEASVRVSVSRGKGRFGIEVRGCPSPTVAVVAKAFVPLPSRTYEKGICAGVVSVRLNEHSPLSGIKSSNYLNAIAARMEAKDKGFDEAILLNMQGFVAEAATSNIFTVRGRKVTTPSCESGILPGVTRKVVLALAGAAGLLCAERPLAYERLVAADEVFLTNSLFEVLPVTRIDRHVIGDGKAGPAAKFIRARYRELTRQR